MSWACKFNVSVYATPSKDAVTPTEPAPSVPLKETMKTASPLASVSAVLLLGLTSPTFVLIVTSSPLMGVATPSRVDKKDAVNVAGERCDRAVTVSPVLLVAARLSVMTGSFEGSMID